jgi:hypothetical protein
VLLAEGVVAVLAFEGEEVDEVAGLVGALSADREQFLRRHVREKQRECGLYREDYASSDGRASKERVTLITNIV